jgi:GH3 auxin-responsive promoter
MSLKSSLSIPLAKWVSKKIQKDASRAILCQNKVFDQLIRKAQHTSFGSDHRFGEINTHSEFIAAVPVRDYEGFLPYIDKIKNGEPDILWPGMPLYLCKTSGTTAGTKYIPLTKESMPNHISSARNALLSYIAETGKAHFVNGKMIFLQGSPKLDKLPSGVSYGRLSGIVANHVPAYLLKNRMPSYTTNCIEDWETKVNAVADETRSENMTLISGIPSWVLMYFEILLQKTGKKNIREIFPDFDLFVFGGVNFEPYRKRMNEIIGAVIPTIETYPASEGFIAYQDSQTEEGLLLNINSGIFFEFIRADEYFSPDAKRIGLQDVEMGTNYALLLSTNAGLWSYSIGDTVRFVSADPPRIKVTGRIKHFTSAFGEHVIGEEVDKAMAEACEKLGLKINEFHVAPLVHPTEGLPYHEWFVEMENPPKDPQAFALLLDNKMREQNVYYNDLVKGSVLRPAVLTLLEKGSFNNYMKSAGKLGGQNKVPRLANDRKIADALKKFSKIL